MAKYLSKHLPRHDFSYVVKSELLETGMHRSSQTLMLFMRMDFMVASKDSRWVMLEAILLFNNMCGKSYYKDK